MGAPNLTHEQLAATRLDIAGKLRAAEEAHRALVARDEVAEAAAAELSSARADVGRRRHLVQRAIEESINGDIPGDNDALIRELNEIDAVIATAAKSEARASSELGTARAERARAQAEVASLRARLIGLLS